MESKSKLWYLENFNLFEGMSKEEMMEMAEKVVDSTVKKGLYIYFPEDPSNAIYFLKKGSVKIANVSDAGRESISAVLRPGELFGELALSGVGKREDFAQAMEDDTLICAANINDMEQLLARNPRMTVKITKLMGLRLRKMERRVKDLVFKDARTRIVDLIREMAEDIGKPVGDEVLIKHSLTHQDMANLTASSRQVVTTVMNELRDQNIINFERKRIMVRDVSKLK